MPIYFEGTRIRVVFTAVDEAGANVAFDGALEGHYRLGAGEKVPVTPTVNADDAGKRDVVFFADAPGTYTVSIARTDAPYEMVNEVEVTVSPALSRP